jgi:hypothetical protein
MSSKNNFGGIDLLNYRYVVRGFDDLQTTFMPVREEYVKTREDLDIIVNQLVDAGLCVFILPSSTVMDNFDAFRSSISI